MSEPLRLGTAGWSIPRGDAAAFASRGTHLERYARVFAAVEINSSFYRPHRPATYARWAASVPPGFAFAVKLPKAITHAARLVDGEAALAAFLAEAGGLGRAFGVVLVQLPPSLAFDASVATAFFAALRTLTSVPVACEPRHPTWFGADADALLADRRVARVAADPARVPAAAEPGGWDGLAYWRLHGSPVTYRTSYRDGRIEPLAVTLAASAAVRPTWCIFDNTASQAATGDALAVATRLGG
jgi:uncharacterized protein YecE (DUF72 family)